jgi:hypothetical protein
MPEPNVKKLKEFLEHTTSIFKSLEKELVAYRMVIAAMELLDPEQADLLRQSFQAALKNPRLEQMMHNKYDVPLEAALKQVDEKAAEEDLLKLIRDWKPSKETN